MTNKTYNFPIRIYYEDTDTGGVVYYANYLKFAERARTEVLRSHGIEQEQLFRTHNVGFAVRKCEIEFLKPARLDDLLTVETQLIELNKVSLRMKQIIKRNDDILIKMEVKLAVIDKNMAITKLPEFIKTALAE